MSGQFREIARTSDKVSEDNTWTDIASRQWEAFGRGALEGAYKNGIKHYEDNPALAARDVGIGVALHYALKGPGFFRYPALAFAAGGLLHFGGNATQAVKEAIPRMRENAGAQGSVQEHREWAQKNLGPVAFEFAIMAGTVAGVSAASAARTRMLRGEPIQRAPSMVAPETKPAETITAPPVVREQTTPTSNTSNVVEAYSVRNHVVPGPQAEAQRIASLLKQETDLTLIGKMDRGTRGAWLVESTDGRPLIFKLVAPEDVTSQIRRSADSAGAAFSLAGRTPRYLHVDHTPGYGSWYVQQVLPGAPAPVPSDALIAQMSRMTDRFAGRAVTSEKNWSQSVMDAVYKDSTGWQKRIANSGDEGKQFVSDVREFVAPYQGFKPRTNDIVHGDFQHYNALVARKDRMTGYVDWEGAGNGDRAIDLSRLLYDAYVSEAEIGYRANPATLRGLADKIERISGPAALNTYMGHWMLQVADYGVKVGPDKASMFMGVGRRIMNDLNERNQFQMMRQAAV